MGSSKSNRHASRDVADGPERRTGVAMLCDAAVCSTFPPDRDSASASEFLAGNFGFDRLAGSWHWLSEFVGVQGE
jgi:hypothetical protein